jgi:dipeptidyl-peptidase-4
MRAALGLPGLMLLAACGPAVAPPPAFVAPSHLDRVTDPEPRPSAPSSAGDPLPDAVVDRDLIVALAQTRSFRLGLPVQVRLPPDGRTALFLRSASRDAEQSLFAMDVATGDARLLVSPRALLAAPETLSPEERVRRERMRVHATGFTSLELSKDGAKALVTVSGRVFVVDRATGKAHELPTGDGAAIDPHFSPDGARVAFVRDDDLHIVPVDGGHATRVTHGGSERLTHGLAEFVATEELQRARGVWWSPDGARLLYEEADTSKVDVLTIADPFHAEHAPQRIAYPRPGRPNADIRFGVVAAAGGPTTWAQWDHARFPYVAHASWPKGGPPLLYVLDRLQRQGQLLSLDPATGKTTVLVAEKDDAWIDVDPSVPRWLGDGTGFLWSSERSGAWQLELRDAHGKLVRELLPQGVGYVALADVDEKNRTAVVVAGVDPTASCPWLVPLDGGPARALAPEHGVADARFDASHEVFVSTEATLEAMPRVVVRSVDGATAREVPSLAEGPAKLPVVKIEAVGPDRTLVAIVRPRGVPADRRLPVIDSAYGGPLHAVVQQSATTFVRMQWMADATGAAVVAIDARGTPRRGRDWSRALAGKLGSVPLEGHVTALKALGATHPELDVSRVGVYGWSFGGYFAAMAVLARPDVYVAGVAGAPPADWRDYDTAYTERYLGLPDPDATAYDEASLLTMAKRAGTAGGPRRKLLVIHGTADDNVWFLNGVKLVDALARAHLPYEFLPLAGTTHMLLDPALSEEVWLRTAQVLRDALRQGV